MYKCSLTHYCKVNIRKLVIKFYYNINSIVLYQKFTDYFAVDHKLILKLQVLKFYIKINK